MYRYLLQSKIGHIVDGDDQSVNEKKKQIISIFV